MGFIIVCCVVDVQMVPDSRFDTKFAIVRVDLHSVDTGKFGVSTFFWWGRGAEDKYRDAKQSSPPSPRQPLMGYTVMQCSARLEAYTHCQLNICLT